jgi:hypothetical protein
VVPSADEHLANVGRWAAVEEVVRDVARSPEWATIILFYRAVHLVEAAFARDGVHHQTHQRRTAAVERRWPAAARSYLDLLDLSRLSRYGEPAAVQWRDYETAPRRFAELEATVGVDPS